MSDGNGQVVFSNLVPGAYHVETPSLGGFIPTAIVQGEPTKVSELDPDLLVTPVVTVTSSGAQQTIGVWSATTGTTTRLEVLVPGRLGDLVWNDRNGDGLQEGSESGIGGMTVRLYSAARALLSTDVTDANGTYLFPNLLPGQYYVSFVPPQGNQTQFSPHNTGADGTIDSDADPVTGYTALIALIATMQKLDVDAGLSGVPTSLPVTEEPVNAANLVYPPVITTQK